MLPVLIRMTAIRGQSDRENNRRHGRDQRIGISKIDIHGPSIDIALSISWREREIDTDLLILRRFPF